VSCAQSIGASGVCYERYFRAFERPSCERKRCRRCALPAQSMTLLSVEVRLNSLFAPLPLCALALIRYSSRHRRSTASPAISTTTTLAMASWTKLGQNPVGVFTPYAAYELTPKIQKVNFTTTRTQGWQRHCWEWARSGQPFLLHGIGAQNLVFCDELRAAYKYYFSCNDSIATFLPEDSVRDVSKSGSPTRLSDFKPVNHPLAAYGVISQMPGRVTPHVHKPPLPLLLLQ
jgi:hypothetical protein